MSFRIGIEPRLTMHEIIEDRLLAIESAEESIILKILS